ncbi:TPA: phage tail protein [Vibrio parahaemolyticus]|nr:phage tail protein [Vibrio parahaemolyticus]
MSNALIPVITDRGLAAVFNSQSDGLAARITHMALGDNGRKPSKNETRLVSERIRIPIAEGTRIDPHQIHLAGLADGDKQFWVREIGFMLDDGTMLAVWSDVDPLAYKSAAVPLLLAFDLKLAALPANSVTITGSGGDLSLAAYANKFIANVYSTMLSNAAAIQAAHENLKLSERVRELEI